MSQKLKAFTLMELMVSMLISGIVISIIYLSYEIVYKQYLNYKITNQKITQTLLLNTLLNTDFAKAHSIVNQDKVVLFVNTSGQNIAYVFKEFFVLRKVNEIQDTFFLPVREFQIRFDHEKQEVPYGLIEDLSFQSSLSDELHTFQFHKWYGADVLMEAQTQH